MGSRALGFKLEAKGFGVSAICSFVKLFEKNRYAGTALNRQATKILAVALRAAPLHPCILRGSS